MDAVRQYFLVILLILIATKTQAQVPAQRGRSFTSTGVTFAQLTNATIVPQTPGTIVWVTDGSPTTPCTGSGPGAFAFRTSTQWSCTVVLGSLPSAPPLVNPQNPVNFGADNTGAADSGTAFQTAVNTGDVLVPAGDFRIDTTVNLPNNRNIQCAAGSDLRYTNIHTTDWWMFIWNGTIGGSVFNCNFRGLNYNLTTNKIWIAHALNFLEIYSSVTSAGGGQHISGNDFNGGAGYVSAIHIYSPGPQLAPTNVLIDHNSFENCGHYGIQLTAATNVIFRANKMLDCNGYIESDTPDQQMNNNLVDQNHSTFIYGTAYAQNTGQQNQFTNYFTCGSSCGNNACNFSGNTCSNNLIDGPQSSGLVMTALGGVQNNAIYISNTCTAGCTVH